MNVHMRKCTPHSTVLVFMLHKWQYWAAKALSPQRVRTGCQGPYCCRLVLFTESHHFVKNSSNANYSNKNISFKYTSDLLKRLSSEMKGVPCYTYIFRKLSLNPITAGAFKVFLLKGQCTIYIWRSQRCTKYCISNSMLVSNCGVFLVTVVWNKNTYFTSPRIFLLSIGISNGSI